MNTQGRITHVVGEVEPALHSRLRSCKDCQCNINLDLIPLIIDIIVHRQTRKGYYFKQLKIVRVVIVLFLDITYTPGEEMVVCSTFWNVSFFSLVRNVDLFIMFTFFS